MENIIAQMRRIILEPNYEAAINLWLEHLATDPDFLQKSRPTQESKQTIMKAMEMVASKVFRGHDFVINSISLRKHSGYKLIHGGGFIEDCTYVLIYFLDLEVGCVLLYSDRTYHIRISNLYNPINLSGRDTDESQWN